MRDECCHVGVLNVTTIIYIKIFSLTIYQHITRELRPEKDEGE